jgi:A/G-specific adenine glycosylase
MPLSTNDFKTKLTVVHRSIATWYKAHGRHHLPWRKKGNPYHVYISEVMLQQTQVKTVLERYYFPFLKRFPTLAALAKAQAQDVMKAWEGLGYYTRARNLHAAAKQCKGKLPDTVEGLIALPGVGRNTAHAVACFGFGAAVPVMEANVKRVLARVFAMKALDDAALWQHAEALLNTKNSFDHNQAMMDIGSLLCTKANPRCSECPLGEICKGRAEPQAYPAAKSSKKTKVRERVIVVFKDAKGLVYVEKRTTRFLGGLWGFVEYETAPVLAKAQLLGQIRQLYSHFTLEAKVLLVPAKTPPRKGGQWVAQEALGTLPLSRADAKIVALLEAYCH